MQAIAGSIREQVGALSDRQSMEMAERYGTHNYNPLPINIVRATGARAWDGAGKEYIDCIGCYSAVANGHLSPAVMRAMAEQMEVLTLISRAVYTPESALFLKTICEYTGMDKCCPMNTGAEAVETCIKLARKWGYKVKGIPEGQAEIIVAEGNFHGRTTTIVGFSSEPGFRDGFGPFTPGFVTVPFGDLDALKAAITPNTAAVLMEPVQIEGGILFPPPGFLSGARKVCDENDVLLCWDEVQTGFYRTGKRFGWMHEEAKPDMMCLGKALGGGVFPVSAAVGVEKVMSVFGFGDHGSTFGGNPLGAAVAIAAMQDMEQNRLGDSSERMGALLFDGLSALKLRFPGMIEDVRGKGLLVGLDVGLGAHAKALAKALPGAGILTKETRSGTFRYTPPLVVDETDVAEIVERTEMALASV